MEDLIRVSSSCCDITSWHASAYHRAEKAVWSYFVILDFGRYQLGWRGCKRSCSCFYHSSHSANPTAPLQVLIHFLKFFLPPSFAFGCCCCHQHLRLEPKINWTSHCGAGLGQTNIKATVVFTSICMVISVQLSMTSVRVSWAGLLETSVCADFIKVTPQLLMFWLGIHPLPSFALTCLIVSL